MRQPEGEQRGGPAASMEEKNEAAVGRRYKAEQGGDMWHEKNKVHIRIPEQHGPRLKF